MEYSEDKMFKVLDELIEAQGGADIPGLTVENVVPVMVQAQYSDTLNEIEDEEAREEKRKSLESYYTDGKGKSMVQTEIANIKANFASARSCVESVAKAATTSTASNLIPSVITVGSASSAPNPAYTAIENATKKAQLQATLNSAAKAFTDLIQSAITIAFPLPGVILNLIELFVKTKKIVDNIPG